MFPELLFMFALLADAQVTPWERTPEQTASLNALGHQAEMARSRVPSDVLNAILPTFHGRPPRYAFDRLGYPDKKMSIDGVTIYSWINEDPSEEGGDLHCTVKVIVRSAKIVKTDFFGNEGACGRFARALDPTFHWY